ncbi:hypothetical protein BJ684DRAFT_15604 [Piptocephalis cylindrospora]|uniref:Amino-acid acetyltransferase, mitochondrial n=1 Tax=Piptocephalis cylindrospora TaxID=1907219 RepID=A0A4P9Y4Z7_9FUNG|nr:hypothetical protein BJ684DRAFT_15604 [Piptocephalis cylindrospora]|eukprot:RKP14056.1 hypothetical protein BJ684DRAFT_15604 [Piptocephalis cylindrospora]
MSVRSPISLSRSRPLTFSPEEDREIIREVLQTLPSKREARHFLREFGDTHPGHPDTLHIALTHLHTLTGEMTQTAALTLVRLSRLGLWPIIVVDDRSWMEEGSTPAFNPHSPAVQVQERICRALDSTGAKAIPMASGIFTMDYSSGRKAGKDPSLFYPPPSIHTDLSLISRAIHFGSIPVILPIGITNPAMKLKHFPSSEALLALSKAFSLPSSTLPVPHRLLLLSPDLHLRKHALINLADELPRLQAELSSRELEAIRLAGQCLEYGRPTTSVILSSPLQSSIPIANLITDKPSVSPSLPPDRKPLINATILRKGLPVSVVHSLEELDLPRVFSLLESSFSKTIDRPSFTDRLAHHFHRAIIVGDHEGLAIVTKEGPGQAVYYLDKFAVAPASQGLSIADILWNRLVKECPVLSWRSRSDNPVNPWYFERAQGHVLIPHTNWTVFWYGFNRGVGEWMKRYMEVASHIPASFLPPPSPTEGKAEAKG